MSVFASSSFLGACHVPRGLKNSRGISPHHQEHQLLILLLSRVGKRVLPGGRPGSNPAFIPGRGLAVGSGGPASPHSAGSGGLSVSFPLHAFGNSNEHILNRLYWTCYGKACNKEYLQPPWHGQPGWSHHASPDLLMGHLSSVGKSTYAFLMQGLSRCSAA